MQMLLITVVGPQQRVDLQVPGELPVSDLLPPLLEMCGPPRETMHIHDSSLWKLNYQSTTLSSTSSLLHAGVLDGAVLVLQHKTSHIRQSEIAEPRSRQFVPRSISPNQSTGGIGITWSTDGLSSES